MFGRGEGGDRWLVLDAVDGRVVAEALLPTVGQGAHQVVHPDGRHVLLDVGEGQDGCTCSMAGGAKTASTCMPTRGTIAA